MFISFFALSISSLLTTLLQCTPYHYKGNAVILGDAAHAMVPFYGQGMNAGFEDCIVLDELIARYGGDMEQALETFSRERNPDAEAICDLAVANYIEMRSKVVSPWYHVQRSAAAFLHHLAPSRFIPLYSMVAFTRIPYSQVMPKWNRCEKKREKVTFLTYFDRQLRIINWGLGALGTTVLAGVAAAGFFVAKHKLLSK